MKKDTPSYEELRQDHARHWKQIGEVRDARYDTTQRMMTKPWRCPVCTRTNDRGGVCGTCHEARILEIE